jgi:AcrR family transcriptional regulator
MTGKALRRTQAERSAGTREALLAAAIEVLHEQGYAATSTMLVAERAGVSRGAMLHQFRTKTDLMTFVVEAVFDEELQRYGEYLKNVASPEQRLLAYPEMAWEVLSRPSGVAVLEILQGSRSDPQLCEKLAPVQARIEEQALAFTHLAAPDDSRGAMALMRLVVWAVRGLSIAQVLAPAPGHVRDSVKLLRRLMEAGLETGILSVGGRQDK